MDLEHAFPRQAVEERIELDRVVATERERVVQVEQQVRIGGGTDAREEVRLRQRVAEAEQVGVVLERDDVVHRAQFAQARGDRGDGFVSRRQRQRPRRVLAGDIGEAQVFAAPLQVERGAVAAQCRQPCLAARRRGGSADRQQHAVADRGATAPLHELAQPFVVRVRCAADLPQRLGRELEQLGLFFDQGAVVLPEHGVRRQRDAEAYASGHGPISFSTLFRAGGE